MTDDRGTPPRSDGHLTPAELATLSLDHQSTPPLDRVRVLVVAGPDRGLSVELGPGTWTVGVAESADVRLSDGAVSRRHLEIDVGSSILARDLGSKNGSYFLGARFDTIRLDPRATIVVGQSALTFMDAGERHLPVSLSDRFGGLLGRSLAIRRVFAELERVAVTDATVLLIAETGSGKEVAAQAIHGASARAAGAMVVADMGAVPPALLESELFGHVRGAFTGAERSRAGLLAQADGGTLFLDEVGELPVDLQPRLLRAIEQRAIRPIGAQDYRQVDTRIIAATNRNLVAEVQNGRFREDLYHRLSVVEIRIPPLRERRDDVEFLARHFCEELGARSGRPLLLEQSTIAALSRYDWPGNVRQLRNVLERAAVFARLDGGIPAEVLGLDEARAPLDVSIVEVELSLKEARDRLIERWEREYLVAQIDRAEGNISQAARHSGIDRTHFHRLMRKYRVAR